MFFQKGLFYLAIILGLLLFSFKTQAIAPSDLVISKIQITGGTGLTTHDFVSIYNRSNEPIDLKGMRLVKRTKTGTTDTTLKSWTTSVIINSGAYYTWANNDIATIINVEASSSQTISSDNGVAIREGAENTGLIIDSVGWGSAANDFVESSPFSTNHLGGQHLERINNLDTNDNSVDFQIIPPIIEEEEEIEIKNSDGAIVPEATGKDIIINELFVNPKEIDGQAQEKEFIEIYNKGEERAALDNWRIEIGEIVYSLPAGTTLAPHGFTTIRDPKNIPLPNEGATIKLFAPERVTATQTITYKKSNDGLAYANFSGAWRWTAISTPDAPNILAQTPTANFEILGVLLPGVNLKFDSSDSFTANKNTQYLWDFGDGQVSTVAYPEHSFNQAGKYKISLIVKNDYGQAETSKTIVIKTNNSNSETTNKNLGDEQIDIKKDEEKIIEEKTDNLFTATGIAVNLPGEFGSQYFYFLPNHGEPLYQIYNNKKLFPKIKLGDELEITGEYSEKETGPQLKTKTANDIKIVGQKNIPTPELINSSGFNLPPYPRLAKISGEILSKKSPRLILGDGQGEIEIYLAKNINLKISDFDLGEKIIVTGILNITGGTPRLQPRSINDIEKITKPEVTVASFESKAEKPITSVINLTSDKIIPKKITPFYYLIILGIVVLGASIYFIYKKSP